MFHIFLTFTNFLLFKLIKNKENRNLSLIMGGFKGWRYQSNQRLGFRSERFCFIVTYTFFLYCEHNFYNCQLFERMKREKIA